MTSARDRAGCGTPVGARVRAAIEARCALRETQTELAKCDDRLGRTFDLGGAAARRGALRHEAARLERRLASLEAPRADATGAEFVRALEYAYDRGRPAVYDAKRARGGDVAGGGASMAAQIAPGWFVAASRVRGAADARACLAHLERHSAAWRRDKLRATPRRAVPCFVSAREAHERMQNLPAWQAARVTLLACALRNRAPTTSRAALDRWMAQLDVAPTHAEGLRALHAELRGRT